MSALPNDRLGGPQSQGSGQLPHHRGRSFSPLGFKRCEMCSADAGVGCQIFLADPDLLAEASDYFTIRFGHVHKPDTNRHKSQG